MEEMKMYHSIITDIWQLFKKYYLLIPFKPDDWETIFDDLNQIEKKYDKNRMAVEMAISAAAELKRLNEEAGGAG